VPGYFPDGRFTPCRFAAEASAKTLPPTPLPCRSALLAWVSVFFDGGMIRYLPLFAI
jgi:hypothetical protein